MTHAQRIAQAIEMQEQIKQLQANVDAIKGYYKTHFPVICDTLGLEEAVLVEQLTNEYAGKVCIKEKSGESFNAAVLREQFPAAYAAARRPWTSSYVEIRKINSLQAAV